MKITNAQLKNPNNLKEDILIFSTERVYMTIYIIVHHSFLLCMHLQN